MNRNDKILNSIYSPVLTFIIIFIVIISDCNFKYFKEVDKFMDYISIFFLICFIPIYFIKTKDKKIIILLLLFISILTYSTIKSIYSNYMDVIKVYYKVIFVSMYIDLGLKKFSQNTINSLFYALSIIIIINTCTIILYPDGWFSTSMYSNNWFIGYDNTHIMYYIPTLLCIIVKTKYKKINIYDCFIILCILYSTFFCFSANSVMTIILIFTYLIFKKKIDSIPLMRINTYMIFIVIFFILIVVLRLQNIFSWLIVEILHKDITFSGRTAIWDKIISYIKLKPFIGYGIESGQIIAKKIGGIYFTHAHNTILDIAYKAGIIGVIPFIFIIYNIIKKLKTKEQNSLFKTMAFVFFSSLLMIIFEAREDKIGLYLIFLFIYNIDYITNMIYLKKVRGRE